MGDHIKGADREEKKKRNNSQFNFQYHLQTTQRAKLSWF